MEQYKKQFTAREETQPDTGDGDGHPSLDLDIPHENIGELVEVGGVLVSGGRAGVKDALLSLENGGGEGSQGGRKCVAKSARKLGKRWAKIASGLPDPTFRTSFMGGIVAEWRGEGGVSLEFSRRLKRAWIDISSSEGDWGMEIRLRRGGWKRLGKRLRRIVPKSD